MEKNKKKQDSKNRFAYDSDQGLELVNPSKKQDNEQNIDKSEQNDIKGGLADNMTIEDIAKKHKIPLHKILKEFIDGIKVEMEHTNDESKAGEIAKDHLFEFPDYYTRLNKMETEAKKDNKNNE